jgi:hypothetical protein
MDKNTLNVNYEKRRNNSLFKQFQSKKLLDFEEIQNYVPIYTKFFSLSESNYNSINLNNTLYLKEIQNSITGNNNLFNCTVEDKSGKSAKKLVFFKLAPLLDPFKYIVGKYDNENPMLFNLPKLVNEVEIHSKILDVNNSASIDGLFSYLSSLLIYKYNFIHGVDYYGSFFGIKNDFIFNIADDLEYLCKSTFFNKNKNVLFQVENYDYLMCNEKPLTPIKIDYTNSNKSISVDEINEDMFENIFDKEYLSLDELKEHNIDLVDIMNKDVEDGEEKEIEKVDEKELDTNINTRTKTSTSSGSTCSSRTSYTENLEQHSHNLSETDETEWEDIEENSDCGDHIINATLPKFPIQVICMEYCENTFDDLIMNNELSHDEWFSALMQIIMILIMYQKVFSFTHNDLHTNNVMYTNTDLKYIYYCYKKKYYRVPTFGKIFKIIDFGRAIYKYNGKTFCSDSFQPGSDAATQYNTEPYFNEKKPRLEPNYSFDICRLACSIFDYVIDDLEDIVDLEKCKPIVRLINSWCLDDNGLNVLYKNNGDERYPDFKLYKMIARCVHNHTPQAQLDRKEFAHFCINPKNVKGKNVIDIDACNF